MTVRIITGDCRTELAKLPAESVHCCVTSPPYHGLRDYRVEGQMGLEDTPEAYIEGMVAVFREVKRVLRKDGTVFLNLGDSYTSGGRSTYRSGASDNKGHLVQNDMPRPETPAGLKPKDLMMMPARVALALQADGWWLRSMMPWLKRSAMPESASDRPATAIEYVFLLTKNVRYFFDMGAVRKTASWTRENNPDWQIQRAMTNEQKGCGNRNAKSGGFTGWDATQGRNFRNSDLFYDSLELPYGLISSEDGPLALDVNPAGYSGVHFATFPPKLVEPCIKAGTSEKGCCAECGAPWVRETQTDRTKDPVRHTGRAAQGNGDRQDAAWPRMVTTTKTTGWSPSCTCKAACVPATVLDCFGGAGTTGLVADRLGRNATLIELNPDYADMARARISNDAPLFAEVQ